MEKQLDLFKDNKPDLKGIFYKESAKGKPRIVYIKRRVWCSTELYEVRGINYKGFASPDQLTRIK